MAKIESIFGKMTGSIGNVTMRHQKGLTSVMSVKANQVKNPKTVAQNTQRMKVRPAHLFYNAFESILNHSRKGLQVGEEHRQAFMSEVLKNTFNGVPYVVKGTNYFVPGLYPMSKGSLIGLDTNTLFDTVSGKKVFCLNVPDMESSTVTIGRLSEKLIAAYPQLQNGDELCFVTAEILPDGTGFIPKINYLVLDITRTAGGPENVLPTWLEPEVDKTRVYINNSMNTVAGALIVSRKEGEEWNHSNSYMKLEGDLLSEVFSPERYEAAERSYSDAGVNEINSPYILRQATTQPLEGQIKVFNATVLVRTVGTDRQPYDVEYLGLVEVPVTNSASSPANVKVFNYNLNLVGKNGDTLYVYENGTAYPVMASALDWDGPVVEWNERYKSQINF